MDTHYSKFLAAGQNKRTLPKAWYPRILLNAEIQVQKLEDIWYDSSREGQIWYSAADGLRLMLCLQLYCTVYTFSCFDLGETTWRHNSQARRPPLLTRFVYVKLTRKESLVWWRRSQQEK